MPSSPLRNCGRDVFELCGRLNKEGGKTAEDLIRESARESSCQPPHQPITAAYLSSHKPALPEFIHSRPLADPRWTQTAAALRSTTNWVSRIPNVVVQVAVTNSLFRHLQCLTRASDILTRVPCAAFCRPNVVAFSIHGS